MSNLRTVNKTLTDATNPVSSFNTEVIDVTNLHNFSFQVICGGTVACTATVQFSNQLPENGVVTQTFTAITGASQAISSGTSFGFNLFYQSYKYVRVAVTAISGTGNLKIIYNGKSC